MRHSPRSLALIAIAASVLAAACGSSNTSSANALAGKSPADVVQASAVAAKQTSMRFDLSANVGFDASKLNGFTSNSLSPLEQLVASGIKISGKGDIENSQRVRLTITAALLGDKPITVVLYDGRSYLSVDGTHFYEGALTNLSTTGIQIDPDQITKFLDVVGTVTDKGSTTQDGQQVEHYQATIDQSKLQALLSQQFGGGSGSSPGAGAALGQLLLQLFSFQDATVDDYVDPATGRIERLGVKFGIVIDFDKLAQAFGGSGGSSTGALPGGKLTINVDVGIHLYDYGAKITVQQPTVDPNAPKLPGGGGLFGA